MKDSILDSFKIKQINIKFTPTNPNMAAANMNANLHHLNPFINSGSVNGRADIAVIDTTIIIIGETIPAFTAASPNIKAPTIDRALLLNDGILRLLSLNISKDNIIIKASKKAGKGTFSLWEAKLINKSVGNNSWLNVVIAIYKAGVNIDIKNAIYLIILVYDMFILFIDISSLFKKKSFNTAGIINT